MVESLSRQSRKLNDAFHVLAGCLTKAYEGDGAWFPTIALQLRLILFDKSPLIMRVEGDLRLPALASIELPETSVPILDELENGRIVRANVFQYAMPFEIYSASRREYFVNLLLDSSKRHLDVISWGNQTISTIPTPLSIRDIVRTICDKDGGAHVDDEHDALLSYMSSPISINGVVWTEVSYADAILMAVARFALVVAEKLGRGSRPQPSWYKNDAPLFAVRLGQLVHGEKHDAQKHWLDGFLKNPLKK